MTVYLVIGSLAAVENVFPPVPADTIVALGVFLSHFGATSAGIIFSITWAANLASAAVVYVAARTLGRRFVRGPIGRRLMRPQSLERLERLYERHGTWGIFLSRFIPGVRAVVPPFAGIARLGAVRALVPAAIASGIWYGAITLAVVFVARRLTDVARLVAEVNRAALVLVGAVVIFVVVFIVARHLLRAGGTNA